MASNPYVNKVGLANGTTLIDLSTDTATQADVAQGKYFHLPTGERVQGTASGGGVGGISQDQDGYLVLDDEAPSPTPSGGGLEYEEGTWTPTENTNYPAIPFTNAHSEPPIIIRMIDSGSAFTPTDTAIVSWGYFDAWKAVNGSFPRSSSEVGYGVVEVAYVSPPSAIGGSRQILTHTSDETGSGNLYPSYYATSSEIKPYTLGTRYYISGRTYKWIAVWAPTT